MRKEPNPQRSSDPGTGGGASPRRQGSRHNDRRCIATGEALAPDAPAIRFVAGPGGELVPDLAEKLPGRGAWIGADRARLLSALKKGLFARAFRRQMAPVPDPEGFADSLEAALAERALNAIGLARRAGAMVAGFEKTRASVQKGTASVYIHACDAGEDGIAKIMQAAASAPDGALRVICPFPGSELDRALGMDNVVHLGVTVPGMAARIVREARRYQAWRGVRPDDGGTPA